MRTTVETVGRFAAIVAGVVLFVVVILLMLGDRGLRSHDDPAGDCVAECRRRGAAQVTFTVFDGRPYAGCSCTLTLDPDGGAR
jgi:hypothetical protein